MTLGPLPSTFPATRDHLQRVAAHVLAQARHRATGRFGLRATPGGFGTPAFGTDAEVLRVAAGVLVHERTGPEGAATRSITIDGASLTTLASFAGISLDPAFSVGHDTPPLGNPDAPLTVDRDAAVALGDWYAFGWSVLDAAVHHAAAAHPAAEPSVVQLWPEHFDAGLDLAAAPGVRLNLGASPGDGYHADPYLYVGPWSAERPGDPNYWNAPFGAVLPHGVLLAEADPHQAALAFFRRGITLLAG